ncbi:MAG: transglycosylase SLT domain-containing protein [Lamprobacter sp.]|uniref:lytic transglycosylase domain-containing protein n=1 Tax=Lamprobacter sp. TaxID=3100796 RepID=UPI002B25C6D6|nr:transglycosylase SLT domain-containing protein [Lamprobacter sp.]MEA3640823.1 transglycosylase SLT domain-containing protein [Lamprobacter sp.]
MTADQAFVDLRARLNEADAQEVQRFLARYQGTAAAERLREQWLRRLVREQRWSDYLAAHADNGSTERDCWYRRALFGTGRAAEAFSGLSERYLTGRSLPSDCDPLFAIWAEVGGLRSPLVWARIERALHANNPGVAAFQSRYLPQEQAPWLELMLAVHRRPGLLLEQPITAERVPDEARRQQILVYGLQRLAAEAPSKAEQLLASIGAAERLPVRLAERADAAVGSALARTGDHRGLDYLARLEPRFDNQDLQRQRLRLALRLRAWQPLADWSEQLPSTADELGKWRYWRGKALMQIASGPVERAAAAHAFASAAEERTLWGFLAAELIGRPPALAHQPAPVDARALDQLLGSDLVQQLKTLKALGRDADVRREWLDLVRVMPPEQKLVAAVAAAELGFANESILALSQAAYWDDLNLRFPLAYAEQARQAAAEQKLALDWVYAVIRQESAFDPGIASHAGAVGLMQLMPPTAREVALKRGLPEPERRDLIDPALNISLGTAYLAQMQRRFGGHPLIASAAYNAGPTAVSRWLPEEPMPGDLWMTEIPYAETRQYVRRVLTYRVFYRHRLGLPPLRVGAMLRAVQ